MAAATTIWIPCEAFDVIVSADSSEPTEFEKAAMLFLAWRDNHSLDDLVVFLGLSERMTLDLLIGLWKQGYVLVDAIDGGVRLDPAWKAVVENRRWREVKTAPRNLETVALMRELVSGQIIGDRTNQAAPPPNQAAPVLVLTTLAEAVSQTTLAAAAMKNLRHNSPLKDQTRKVLARLAQPRREDGPQAISWLRLDFDSEVELETDSDRYLTLRSASDDPATARISPGIARALNEWAFGNADHPVVKQLIAAAETKTLQPRQSLAARATALIAAIEDRLDDASPSQVLAAQLGQELEVLGVEIDALEAARGTVTFQELAAEKPSFLDQAVSFKHQLVITSPTLEIEDLERCGETLIPHLKTLPVDASAILLWGAGRATQLSSRAHSFLEVTAAESKAQKGLKLYASSRPSRISTTMGILDGTRVIYSSMSPFARARAGAPFAFLLNIESGPKAGVARQLLELARSRAPEVEIAEIIELAPWSPPEPESALHDPPPSLISLDTEATPSTLQQKAMFHDLLAVARNVARRLDETGPTVEALADADLFMRTLDLVADTDPHSVEPTLWVGLGLDEHLGRSTPLHRRMVEAIKQRAADKLPTVVLIDESPMRGGIDITGLRAVADASPDMVLILSAPGLPGHFVCGEQRLVVAPGGLASPPVVVRRGISSRLTGISAADPALCETFRAALSKHLPSLSASPAAQSRRKPRPVMAAHAAVALMPLLTAWQNAEGSKRAALSEALGDQQSGFNLAAAEGLLDLTSNTAEIESLHLRRDLLAVLAVKGDGPRKQEALVELTLDAWRHGGWQQAALMLESGAAGACAIPADLATAIAAVSVGLTLGTLPDVFQRDDSDSWMAAVAVAVWSVLFNGDAEAAEALEIKLALGAPPPRAGPLREVADAVLAYWSMTGGGVDRDAIKAAAQREEAGASLSVLARAFRDTYRLGLHFNYNKQMLKRVMPRFYLETSGLTPVFDLISEDGAASSWTQVLAALEAIFGLGDVNPAALADRILNKTHKQYATARDEEIMYGKGARIKFIAQEAMRTALNLRNAIHRSRYTLAGSSSVDLPILMDGLNKSLPNLVAQTDAHPDSALSAPIIAGLTDRLTQLMSASK
jgi:hypothetical protein